MVAVLALRASTGDSDDGVYPVSPDYMAPTLPPLAPVPIESVNIDGQDRTLTDKLLATQFCESQVGCYTRIASLETDQSRRPSFVDIDRDGRLIRFDVKPEHEERFTELLGKSLPTPTPIPTVSINGHSVLLHPDLELSRVILSNTGPVNQVGWVITLRDGDGISRVYVDDAGSVVSSDVMRSHQKRFQKVLDAAGLTE
jgi:hypothetical protein